MPEPSTPAATKATAQSREPSSNGTAVSRVLPAAGETTGAYSLGPGVARAASVATYEREPDDPIYRPLRVYTLDPASLAREGATAVLQVPYEPLEPGPKGCLFEVIAKDGERPVSAVDLEKHGLLITQGLPPSASNHEFHQQMVYAVCSSDSTAPMPAASPDCESDPTPQKKELTPPTTASKANSASAISRLPPVTRKDATSPASPSSPAFRTTSSCMK
jgi:hypothetical protein